MIIMKIFNLLALCLAFGGSTASGSPGPCPAGTYSHTFGGFMLSPWTTCVSNWMTPDEFWFIYTNKVPVEGPPPVVWVPQPGDLWLEIESVEHGPFCDFANLTIHGCVVGTYYNVQGTLSLTSQDWEL